MLVLQVSMTELNRNTAKLILCSYVRNLSNKNMWKQLCESQGWKVQVNGLSGQAMWFIQSEARALLMQKFGPQCFCVSQKECLCMWWCHFSWLEIAAGSWDILGPLRGCSRSQLSQTSTSTTRGCICRLSQRLPGVCDPSNDAHTSHQYAFYSCLSSHPELEW